jgi:hypothetical protein
MDSVITDSLRFAEIVEEKGSRVGQMYGARGCRRIDKVLGRTLRRFGVRVVLVDFSDGLLCVVALSRCGDGVPTAVRVRAAALRRWLRCLDQERRVRGGRRCSSMARYPFTRYEDERKFVGVTEVVLSSSSLSRRERNSYARPSPHRIVVV